MPHFRFFSLVLMQISLCFLLSIVVVVANEPKGYKQGGNAGDAVYIDVPFLITHNAGGKNAEVVKEVNARGHRMANETPPEWKINIPEQNNVAQQKEIGMNRDKKNDGDTKNPLNKNTKENTVDGNYLGGLFNDAKNHVWQPFINQVFNPMAIAWKIMFDVDGSGNDKNDDDTVTSYPDKYIQFDEKEDPLEQNKLFGNQLCHCGKHLLREMREWKLGNDEWHFRVWPKPMGQGTTAAVYHAHAMSTLVGIDGKPVTLSQCVAIKYVLLNRTTKEIEDEIRNELTILKAFAERKAKHVIRLHAFKEIPEENRLFYVLELGTHSLFEEIINMYLKVRADKQKPSYNYNDDLVELQTEVKKQLTNILEAVKEMHKLVMHLDLKPENMLFVQEEPMGVEGNQSAGHSNNNNSQTALMLKAIDFGGSEFIPSIVPTMMATKPGMPKEIFKLLNKKRANLCKIRTSSWGTELYMSPEQKYCDVEDITYKTTTKSDMWAVGIMLLHMLFTQRFSVLGVVKKLTNVSQHFDLKLNKKLLLDTRDALIWVHNQFPTLFEIVMSTLHPFPSERPTAYGLLEFLSDKCRLVLSDRATRFLVENNLPPPNLQENKRKAELPVCDVDTTDETNSMEKRKK